MYKEILNRSIDLLSDGNLYWNRTAEPFFVEVPISILTKEQRDKLQTYLNQDDIELMTKNRSSLFWEYWFQPHDQILIKCIELSKEQKDKLVPPKIRDKNSKTHLNTNFKELLDQLNKKTITWQEARDIVLSIKGKPWETKKWKSKRDLKIGKSCEQCGSQEILTLQHLRQPRKYDNALKQLKKWHREKINEWIKKESIEIDLTGIEKTAPCCPKCKSQTIRFRKSFNTWICLSVKNGKKICEHVFEIPDRDVPKSIVIDKEKEEIQRRVDDYIDKSGLGEQAIRTSIQDMLEYLTMDNTITLCKKCAFVADKTNYVLCSYCMKHYHSPYYFMCKECSKKGTSDLP